MTGDELLPIVQRNAIVDFAAIAAYLSSCFAIFALSMAGKRKLKEFLGEHSTIADAAALERFRDLVRKNMIAALVVLALGFVSVVLGLYVMNRTGTTGILLVIVVSLFIFAQGRSIKQLEGRTRYLPCGDEVLKRDYEASVLAWKKKVFPNFK